ncbi:hypothetical protein [Novosphingobium album (ex Liu et al. 2023)]|uniref:hypothetical protein n=1 Tax=Novosphingobium album (ex Liu et al. 2023) TaxID=3031130 RepID=UPI0023B1F998|nr:hypothetical protein [Novosphingobium album (ex Liu et al. 2023)]
MTGEPLASSGSEKSRVISNVDVQVLVKDMSQKIKLLEEAEAHVAAAHMEAAIEALYRQFNMERNPSEFE